MLKNYGFIEMIWEHKKKVFKSQDLTNGKAVTLISIVGLEDLWTSLKTIALSFNAQ